MHAHFLDFHFYFYVMLVHVYVWFSPLSFWVKLRLNGVKISVWLMGDQMMKFPQIFRAKEDPKHPLWVTTEDWEQSPGCRRHVPAVNRASVNSQPWRVPRSTVDTSPVDRRELGGCLDVQVRGPSSLPCFTLQSPFWPFLTHFQPRLIFKTSPNHF